MLPGLNLQFAFRQASHARLNRRVLVALLEPQHSYWWGGHIDKWQAPHGIFPSAAAAQQCHQFMHRFRQGLCHKGGMLLLHRDGAFTAVMLGLESPREASQWLHDAIAACTDPATSTLLLPAAA